MERSRGNVFSDLGFPPEEAANLVLRSQLMMELERVLGPTAADAEKARALGVPRRRLSDLRAGRIERFHVDELIAMLGRLGIDVQLTTSARKPTPATRGLERAAVSAPRRRTSRRLAA